MSALVPIGCARRTVGTPQSKLPAFHIVAHSTSGSGSGTLGKSGGAGRQDRLGTLPRPSEARRAVPPKSRPARRRRGAPGSPAGPLPDPVLAGEHVEDDGDVLRVHGRGSVSAMWGRSSRASALQGNDTQRPGRPRHDVGGRLSPINLAGTRRFLRNEPISPLGP